MDNSIAANVGMMSELSGLQTPSSMALLGFCALYLCLLITLVGYRTAVTLSGKREANDFSPTGDDETGFIRFLIRAHANMYEAFPFWGLLLLGIATGQNEITDGLALACLGLRTGQVMTHLISTRVIAVKIRFGFFLGQIAIFGYWILVFAGVWLT